MEETEPCSGVGFKGLNNSMYADVHGTFSSSVKNREQLKKTYILRGPSCQQQKLLEHSLLNELESDLVAWFKYAYTNNGCVYGILLILLKRWTHYTLSKY